MRASQQILSLRQPFALSAVCLLTGGLALVVACRSSGEGDWPEVVTVRADQPHARLVSNELTVGENRFVFGLLDKDDQPITDAQVQLGFFNLDQSKTKKASTAAAAQIHTGGTVPEYEWLYVGHVNFPTAGHWGAEIEAKRKDGQEFTIRYRFPVKEKSAFLDVGDPAPATGNLTLTDVGGDTTDRHLTTDPDPDPAMYQMTVAEAIEARKPFVVVLATPGFCVTRTCGPMLDVVKSVRPEFADRVNFIHIEITDLDATTAKGELIYNSFYNEWHVETEPWTFVVDAEGKVFAKFEGVLLPDELRETLGQLLAREDF